jgi:hypothetical protein
MAQLFVMKRSEGQIAEGAAAMRKGACSNTSFERREVVRTPRPRLLATRFHDRSISEMGILQQSG